MALEFTAIGEAGNRQACGRDIFTTEVQAGVVSAGRLTSAFRDTGDRRAGDAGTGDDLADDKLAGVLHWLDEVEAVAMLPVTLAAKVRVVGKGA